MQQDPIGFTSQVSQVSPFRASCEVCGCRDSCSLWSLVRVQNDFADSQINYVDTFGSGWQVGTQKGTQKWCKMTQISCLDLELSIKMSQTLWWILLSRSLSLGSLPNPWSKSGNGTYTDYHWLTQIWKTSIPVYPAMSLASPLGSLLGIPYTISVASASAKVHRSNFQSVPLLFLVDHQHKRWRQWWQLRMMEPRPVCGIMWQLHRTNPIEIQTQFQTNK